MWDGFNKYCLYVWVFLHWLWRRLRRFKGHVRLVKQCYRLLYKKDCFVSGNIGKTEEPHGMCTSVSSTLLKEEFFE